MKSRSNFFFFVLHCWCISNRVGECRAESINSSSTNSSTPLLTDDNVEDAGDILHTLIDFANVSVPAAQFLLDKLTPAIDKEISKNAEKLVLEPLWKQVNTTKDALVLLEANGTKNNERVSELESSSKYMATSMQLLRTDVTSVLTKVEGINNSVVSIKNTIATFDKRFDAVDKRLDWVKTTMEENTDQIHLLQDSAREVIRQQKENTNQIALLQDSTDQLIEQQTDMRTTISNMNAILSDIYTWVKQHNKTLSTPSNNIQTLLKPMATGSNEQEINRLIKE